MLLSAITFDKPNTTLVLKRSLMLDRLVEFDFGSSGWRSVTKIPMKIENAVNILECETWNRRVRLSGISMCSAKDFMLFMKSKQRRT